MTFHGSWVFYVGLSWLGTSHNIAEAISVRKNDLARGCLDDDSLAIQNWDQTSRMLVSSEDAVLDRLWSGADLSEDEWPLAETHRGATPRRLTSQAVSDPSKAETLILLGPMDSGTHLVADAIQRNFPEKKSAMTQVLRWHFKDSLWKHTVDLASIYDELHQTVGEDLSRTAVVAVVRNPLSNLVAWKHKNYQEIVECMCRPFVQMNESCHARLSYTRKLPDFSSTVDILNTYLRTYRELKNSGKFSSVTIVPYEDMIYSPTETIENIAQGIGWDLQIDDNGAKFINLPGDDRGKHPNKASRLIAMTRLQSRLHLEYIKPAMPSLCGALSQSALAGFGEGAFVEDPSLKRGYAADCEGFPMAI